MGCFDSVMFECPSCKTMIEGQSKSGPCHLASYSQADVPIVIASGVLGDLLHCDSCGKAFVVVEAPSQPRTVQLSLKPFVAEDDDDA